MAITDSQKVDYLWKKIGYGMSKTDTNANKKAFEETISSPLLMRGDTIWHDSGSIPSTQPTTSSNIVAVYVPVFTGLTFLFGKYSSDSRSIENDILLNSSIK